MSVVEGHIRRKQLLAVLKGVGAHQRVPNQKEEILLGAIRTSTCLRRTPWLQAPPFSAGRRVVQSDQIQPVLK